MKSWRSNDGILGDGSFQAGIRATELRPGKDVDRCPARTLAPGSPALASHSPAVYLREDPVRAAVNSWIGHLFDRTNIDRTVAALVASQDGGAESVGHEAAKKRLADAEARLRRFQAAIASGVDPAALVDVINEVQAQRAAARAELDGAPAPNLLSDAEVYAMVDSLGDVGTALSDAKEESLANLYTAVDLQVSYEPEMNAADAGVRLGRRVNSAGVRGGLRTRKMAPPAHWRCPCGACYRTSSWSPQLVQSSRRTRPPAGQAAWDGT